MIDRTNIGLGIGSTELDLAWEADFKNPLNQVVNQSVDLDTGKGFISGLKYSRTSSTSITISTGICRDDKNLDTIKVASSILVDATTNGADGLDTGSLQIDTWYYVFVIKKEDGTVSGLLSESNTNPLMPDGYHKKRLIGCVLTDGSSNFLMFYQYGNSNEREILWDEIQDVLLGGTSSSFASIDVTGNVPHVLNPTGLFYARVNNTTAGALSVNELILALDTGLSPSYRWQFNEGSGVTASEDVTDLDDFTINDGPTWGSGYIDTQDMNLPSGTLYDLPNTDFSIAFWVEPTNFEAVANTFFAQIGNGNITSLSHFSFGFGVRGNNRWGVWVTDGSSSTVLETPSGLVSLGEKWLYIVSYKKVGGASDNVVKVRATKDGVTWHQVDSDTCVLAQQVGTHALRTPEESITFNMKCKFYDLHVYSGVLLTDQEMQVMWDLGSILVLQQILILLHQPSWRAWLVP